MKSKLATVSFALLVSLATAHAWFWQSAAPPANARPALTASQPAPQLAKELLQPTKSASPSYAVATFDNLDGVSGRITFSRKSPNEATEVRYDLRGLKGNNNHYHVHERPVPAFNIEQARANLSMLAAACGATGGHLNPFKITEKLPPKSAPLERYEIGDLSGKHGPMLPFSASQAAGAQQANQADNSDRYVGSYTDILLPMEGENSIVGRSIVIHKNDHKRWVCATINRVQSINYQ